MKLSITMPYYNRKKLLYNMLHSYRKSSLINDCEFIIVDDASDDSENIYDIYDIFPDLDIKAFKYTKEEKWWKCPVIPINRSINESSGDIIILTGSDIFPMCDIPLHVSEQISKNSYLVYGTYALNDRQTNDLHKQFNIRYDYADINIQKSFMEFNGDSGWVQHSFYRNACYNFCTAIMREDLIKLGGFNEEFSHGIAWGDLDFILKVRKNNMNIKVFDEQYCYHQYHYNIPYLNTELSQKNRNLIFKIWDKEFTAIPYLPDRI